MFLCGFVVLVMSLLCLLLLVGYWWWVGVAAGTIAGWFGYAVL